MSATTVRSVAAPADLTLGTRLDRASMFALPDELSRRELRVLRAFFALPAAVRDFLLFQPRPWCLPLQSVLQRGLGGSHEIEVAFAFGPLSGCKFRVHTAEKYFLLGAAFEEHNWATLAQLVKTGDVVYDVGTHAGYWALGLSRLVGSRGKVVALEPSHLNFKRLSYNVLLNENSTVGANIIPLNLAAGEHEGRMQLIESGSTSRFCEEGQQVDCATAGVLVRRLDDLVFRDGKPAPLLMLIDVEGSAGGVLRGAERLLCERRPMVLCEIHNPQENREVDAALDPYGYDRKQQVGRGGKYPLHFLAKPAAA